MQRTWPTNMHCIEQISMRQYWLHRKRQAASPYAVMHHAQLYADVNSAEGAGRKTQIWFYSTHVTCLDKTVDDNLTHALDSLIDDWYHDIRKSVWPRDEPVFTSHIITYFSSLAVSCGAECRYDMRMFNSLAGRQSVLSLLMSFIFLFHAMSDRSTRFIHIRIQVFEWNLAEDSIYHKGESLNTSDLTRDIISYC